VDGQATVNPNAAAKEGATHPLPTQFECPTSLSNWVSE
jgi:hypothetical protein